jgi:outer membrane receptor protein involved in Fe transport
MERNTRVAAAVRQALLVGALSTAAASPAFAQASLEEIVVTGSRIKSPNLEATTPVTQVTAMDVSLQGVTRVEDLINQLPQAFAAQNVTVANGADGTATVNLRGLGSPRTLVLVDGRRMPYGSANNSAANLNAIPTQMVERVDVLTGGASAVYGSDAVAGVVNFILKKDFEGFEVSSQYNFYQHTNDFTGPGQVKLRDVIAGRAATNPAQFALPKKNVVDGEGTELSFMMGVNSEDGRGNITAYGSVFHGNAILQADRDYSACSLATTPPTVSFACGGSSTSAGGRFTDFSTYDFTVDTPTTFRDWNAGTDQYNFGPLNHYQRPERRYSLGADGHYEFNEHAEVYTSVAFNDYESIAQIAPGGNFGDTNTVNCDNPLLPQGSLLDIGCTPAAVAAGDSVPMYILRRNVEGGGRQQQFSQSGFRATLGVKGAINDAWDYDVYTQYSQGRGSTGTANYFVIDRLARALDVIANPDGGEPVCRSVLDGSDPNCVPWNPFVPGGVTADQLGYLQALGIQASSITQEIFSGSVSGDLGSYGWKMPWASDGAQVVFGAETRRDKLTNKVDALQEAAQLSGSGGATIGISGQTKVDELFFEGRLPLAQDQAFADSLSIDGAYRYSDYGSGTTTDTYKVGLEWAPVTDVRFRGSFQRAVRAANIVELFTAQGFNLFDMTGDPCGAADPNPNATLAKCVATGVPAAQYGSSGLDSPAGQFQFTQGGNPDLKPEKSDTQSFGIILTPRFAPGLAVTVDWFNIKIDGTISTFGAQNTLDACYNNDDAAACSRIRRNPLGSLWLGQGNVLDTNINIGSLETTGVDFNASYSGVELGRFGSLGFNLTGTWLDKLVTEPGPGIDKYDCVGYFSSVCGTPNPDWRHRFRTSWQTPWDVDVSLTWRYFAAVTGLASANNPMPANRIDEKFPAKNYFDLSADWAFTEKASVTVGINNILDDNPSINATVGTTGNGNTYPQTYDALGRYVFIRGRVSF